MSVKVTPVLGVVRVLSGAEMAEARPAGNSTKWIFDIEGAANEDIVVQLIDIRGREYSPQLAATTFCPLSNLFYATMPFEAAREGGRITIRHGGVRQTHREDVVQLPPPCKYRVMIDTMHTASR